MRRWWTRPWPSRSKRSISTAVGNAHSSPGIANLLVVNHRIVERNIQSELRQVQFTYPGQQVVGGDDPIMLRGHERGARIHEFLLRIEDVEGSALADPRFFAHAVERDLRARHLRLSGENLRL